PVGGCDMCAHATERLGDAFHRTSAQRGVAVEGDGGAAAGDETGAEPHGGTRVAAVDGARAAVGERASDAFDTHDVAGPGDVGPEGAHGAERCAYVLAALEALDDRGPGRQR